MRVVATVLFDHEPWNFALIEDGLRRKTFIGHVGDQLFKNDLFTVVTIEEDRVVIREGSSPRLTLEARPRPARSRPRAARPPAPRQLAE